MKVGAKTSLFISTLWFNTQFYSQSSYQTGLPVVLLQAFQTIYLRQNVDRTATDDDFACKAGICQVE